MRKEECDYIFKSLNLKPLSPLKANESTNANESTLMFDSKRLLAIKCFDSNKNLIALLEENKDENLIKIVNTAKPKKHCIILHRRVHHNLTVITTHLYTHKSYFNLILGDHRSCSLFPYCSANFLVFLNTLPI